jgi:predicted metal-dependent HD superfamily phosphohydrolase
MIDSNLLLKSAEAYVRSFFAKNHLSIYVYHDLQHTLDTVEEVKKMAVAEGMDEKDIAPLLLAAWFHDTGYLEQPDGHEEISCQIFSSFLAENNVRDVELVEHVHRIIRSTSMGLTPVSLDEKILCDADLSHLGGYNYWEKSANVRHEIFLTTGKAMSEKEWVDFELKFLVAHQFATPNAIDRLEKRKQKHIRTLNIRKLSLDASTAKLAEELLEPKSRKKREEDPGRGVETMYRTTYRTHINLSSIADNKANIMLSINAIIISIVISTLGPRLMTQKELIIPTIFLINVCLSALVFAILSTRPKITEGKYAEQDIKEKKVNLLFFGNYYRMDPDVFHDGMMEMIKDQEFLYSSLTRDLFYLGVVLAKKYHYLRICYGIFMYGLIASVFLFGLALIF